MATDYLQNAIKNLEKQAKQIQSRIDYYHAIEVEATQNKELKMQELEFINQQIEKIKSKGADGNQ